MLSGMANYPPYPQNTPPPQQETQSEPIVKLRGRRISTFWICLSILAAGLFIGLMAKHPDPNKPPVRHFVDSLDGHGVCWSTEAGISCYPTR
ncbi:hypothetical protein AWB95_13950 [Mycobacterium celatum]|uniref:Uncharacterized protein n=2 Tax=Mycobacterium celatum TaxID=28045 RepID=A0A1X1RPP3_MYCCE|nr:hypothetical protein AWB95_13950 [Mycobacterium celatum]PIB79526.1 hypothetical protein CQY23_08090 [Mycobacterium celatum]